MNNEYCEISSYENLLVYSSNRLKKSTTMDSFSAQRRSTILQQCSEATLDVIVVGGGITGAGIFLEVVTK
ncbi:MAG: hypothetical protein R2877_07500 [Bdellovibrionota bacterium]